MPRLRLPLLALAPKVQRLPPRADPPRLVGVLEFLELLLVDFWRVAWPTWLFWLLLVGTLWTVAWLLQTVGLL